MRSLISSLSVLVVAAGGALAVAPPAGSAAAPAAAPASKTTPTAFALAGSGFGTRARGGALPAGSDTTAFQVIGCTNRAGKSNENHVTSVALPGLGTAYGVTTRVWTVTKGSTVSSYSRNSTARVVLGDAATGVVEINGITSLSRAFHDAKGFHARTRTAIGSILYKPAAGEAQKLELPTPGQPVTVPGVATISVGSTAESTSRSHARAKADTISIKSMLTMSTAQVAHSRALIFKGIKSGLFTGRSSSAQGTAAEDHVSFGHTPLSVMPCQGTGGAEWTKSIVRVDRGSEIFLSGLSSRQMGEQTGILAQGFERGRVDVLEINGGELRVEKIVGRVNVIRRAGQVERNTNGTQIGTVTANGETQQFPDSDVLNIPGVAKLERDIVDRSRNGISVTALRITLLDGSGAVLNLGVARLYIKPSGR